MTLIHDEPPSLLGAQPNSPALAPSPPSVVTSLKLRLIAQDKIRSPRQKPQP
jgi:hypothetical protein